MSAFEDIFSSEKGPGVIGSIMAIAVVAGMCALAAAAFEGTSFHGGRSIEVVVQEQADEISLSQKQIRRLEAEVKDVAALKATADKIADHERAIAIERSKLERLAGEKAALDKDIAAVARAKAEYHRLYREQVRGDAVGTKLAEMKTSSGRVFRNTTITKVDAVGVTFLHESGSARVDYEELAEEFQKRFHYDPAEKSGVLHQETALSNQQTVAADKFKAQQERKSQESAARENEARKAQASNQIVTLNDLIKQLDDEIQRERMAWDNDRMRVKSYGGTLDSAGYERRIRALTGRRNAATENIRTLQRDAGL